MRGIWQSVNLGCFFLVANALAVTPAPPTPPLWEAENWQLEQKLQDSSSFRLIGRDVDGGEIALECYAKSSSIGIFVSLGRTEGPNEEPLKITVRNEQDSTAEAVIPVIESGGTRVAFALVDTLIPTDGPRGASAFLTVIRSARTFFAIDHQQRSQRFDARLLPAGWKRLQEFCAAVR